MRSDFAPGGKCYGVMREWRDIPAVLQKWSFPIRRELIEIRAKIARGEITWATRFARSPRRKK